MYRKLDLTRFYSLHKQQEEQLWEKSFNTIQSNPEMHTHALMLDAVIGLLNLYITKHPTAEDLNTQVLKHLAIRQLNGILAAWKLLLGGYYQKSGLIIRDLYETVSLIQYFQLYPHEIDLWSTMEETERKKKFRPAAIRTALESNSQFANPKRKEIYSMYSSLAAHPTPEGFCMVTTKDGYAISGPYFEELSLRAGLGELGMRVTEIGQTWYKYCGQDTSDQIANNIRFKEALHLWRSYFSKKKSVATN